MRSSSRLGERRLLGRTLECVPMSLRVTTRVPRAGLLSLLAVAGLAGSCAPRPSGPPNVLLVTLDALRADHVSAFGYERETTPHLDWLIERGRVFDPMIPTGCSTKASLTSLVTALDYGHHRMLAHQAVLEPEHLTLAEVFSEAGYRTAGVLATPHLAAEFGYDQGYDDYVDFADTEDHVVGAAEVERAALELLDRAGDPRPFFLHVHFQEPHPPWRHGSPWLEASETDGPESFFGRGCNYLPTSEQLAAVTAAERRRLVALYDGALRRADQGIGALLDALRKRGALSQTLVAVTTDHGLELLDRSAATHGENPFDEVVRSFFVVYDGRAEIEGEIEAFRGQSRIQDVGATLLGGAGLAVPERFDGVDLLDPEAAPPRLAFVKCYNAEVVRSLRYKLADVHHPSPQSGRRHPVGLEEGLHLYDLQRDPAETVNLRDREPELVARLSAALEIFRGQRALEAATLRDEDSEISDVMRERLRALGYID